MNERHGWSGTPTYKSWEAMIQRTSNTDSKDYAAYGGRGITVCPQWLSFVTFLEDMGKKPPGLTLGRIKNEEGYTPGNCRWETQSEQNGNRRFLGRRKSPKTSSKFPGVSWSKSAQKWGAYVKVGGRQRHLGWFDREDIAGLAVRQAKGVK